MKRFFALVMFLGAILVVAPPAFAGGTGSCGDLGFPVVSTFWAGQHYDGPFRISYVNRSGQLPKLTWHNDSSNVLKCVAVFTIPSGVGLRDGSARKGGSGDGVYVFQKPTPWTSHFLVPASEELQLVNLYGVPRFG